MNLTFNQCILLESLFYIKHSIASYFIHGTGGLQEIIRFQTWLMISLWQQENYDNDKLIDHLFTSDNGQVGYVRTP